MTKANKIKKVKKEKDSTLKKKLNKENCKCIEIKESDIKVGRLTGKDAAKRVFQEQQLRKIATSKKDERTIKHFQ